MVAVNENGDESGKRFVVPSLVIRSRRRYRQPEKEVNVVCIGKQNHNILYDKMKLLVSVATCENAKKTVKLQARTREEHVVVLV